MSDDDEKDPDWFVPYVIVGFLCFHAGAVACMAFMEATGRLKGGSW